MDSYVALLKPVIKHPDKSKAVHLSFVGADSFLCESLYRGNMSFGSHALYHGEKMCSDCIKRADISDVPSRHYKAMLPLIE